MPDSKQVILLDLGGVVLGIDFRRVFRFWASAAGTEESLFYENWRLDQAYKDQEVGLINFDTYCEHLSNTLSVDMSSQQWREGWNALWTEPHLRVAACFPALKTRFKLCAFSNTNAEHAANFMQKYPEVMGAFDRIFLSHEVGCRKPSAASFKHVCQLMDVEPEQVTFLDDSEENVNGAIAAGMTAHHTRTENEVVAVLNTL